MLMTLAAATMASEDVSSFIVGGVNATVAEHPYMAGIFNFGLHSCGGSILSASNVLTVTKLQPWSKKISENYFPRPRTVFSRVFLEACLSALDHRVDSAKAASLIAHSEWPFIQSTFTFQSHSSSRTTSPLSAPSDKFSSHRWFNRLPWDSTSCHHLRRSSTPAGDCLVM